LPSTVKMTRTFTVVHHRFNINFVGIYLPINIIDNSFHFLQLFHPFSMNAVSLTQHSSRLRNAFVTTGEDVSFEELLKLYLYARKQFPAADLKCIRAYIHHVDNEMAELVVSEAGLMKSEEAIIFLKNVIKLGFDHMYIHDCLEATCELVAKVRFLHTKARRIQCHFKNAISNPDFLLCRKRLLREFDDLYGS